MRICVFCGSSMGNREIYKTSARKLAQFFCDQNIGLVYGGANVGIMKVLADTMIENQKEVIGVMPVNLIKNEVGHSGLTQFIEVDTMSERKEKMLDLSDAFIALPGGFGTLDELTEILTYNQLRISDKPLGILNVDGYFDLMLKFYDFAVEEGFVRKEHRDNLIVSDNITELLSKMNDYKPLGMGKWLNDIKEESYKD